MQKEIWRDVEGYEGLYMVSSLGNIKSLSRTVIKSNGSVQVVVGRNLKPNKDTKGYLKVELSVNGKKKTRRIHQMVAESFLNHKPCGMDLIVDHINNNRLDNRLSNIQLINCRENLTKDKRGASKYPGVHWHKRIKKWCSSIRINGRLKHLGYFDNEKEAYKSYMKHLKTLK